MDEKLNVYLPLLIEALDDIGVEEKAKRFCLALYYCELLLQGQFEQSYSSAYQYSFDEGLDLLLRYLYSKDNHNIYGALTKTFLRSWV